MKVEVDVWDMKEGKITSIKLGEQVFVLNGQNIIHNVFPVRKHKRYSNTVDTWIKNNNINEFSFEQFQKSNPGVKRNRFNHFVSLMIQDHCIIQLGNDKFGVVR